MSPQRKLPASRKAVTDAEYRDLSEFRRTIHAYLDFSDRAARTVGLEPRQYQLMLAIKGRPGDMEPSVGALAQHLKVRHHSAVELINRTVRNGFVARERSSSGRHVLVKLTAEGNRVLEKAVAERLKELQSAGPVLVETLRRLLRSGGRAKG